MKKAFVALCDSVGVALHCSHNLSVRGRNYCPVTDKTTCSHLDGLLQPVVLWSLQKAGDLLGTEATEELYIVLIDFRAELQKRLGMWAISGWDVRERERNTHITIMGLSSAVLEHPSHYLTTQDVEAANLLNVNELSYTGMCIISRLMDKSEMVLMVRIIPGFQKTHQELEDQIITLKKIENNCYIQISKTVIITTFIEYRATYSTKQFLPLVCQWWQSPLQQSAGSPDQQLWMGQ